jgi:ketosteroid isomerase-like protein
MKVKDIMVTYSSLSSSIQLVLRFNEALNAADVDGMLRCMTPDCVFESTEPPPDGQRIEGQAVQRSFWEAFFRSSSQAHITVEDIFASGNGLEPRVVMLWRYEWVDLQGRPGHVRGVDIYKLEGGLIAEKLSYVKG